VRGVRWGLRPGADAAITLDMRVSWPADANRVEAAPGRSA
jgi:hypothetical protein